MRKDGGSDGGEGPRVFPSSRWRLAPEYTEVSTGATKASGVCSVAGTGAARLVTCVITLKTGKSTLTVSAVKTSAVLVKAIRLQTA